MKQATQHIMMVRPMHFGFDPETAESNAFQSSDGADRVGEISTLAIKEFDAAVDKLRSKGVKVTVIEDTAAPVKPNAVFPNNWISFHPEKLILYPMLAESRRDERRLDIVETLQKEEGVAQELVDLSMAEAEGKFLESTGSIVFDYENKLAYACLSPRTDGDLLEKLCELIGFEAVAFHANDRNDQAIYHTNVMMCLAANYAVICSASIPLEERSEVLGALSETGHQIINLSLEQIENFAGNMLEVEDVHGQSVLVMSKAAFQSLTGEQINVISQYSEILSIPIPTIEKYGGGSIRCMMCRVN